MQFVEYLAGSAVCVVFPVALRRRGSMFRGGLVLGNLRNVARRRHGIE